MYLFNKPGDDQINEFMAAQSRLEFTYPNVGTTREANHPSGYQVDHNRVQLGSGPADFEAFCRALRDWQHFRFDWVELHGPDADPTPKQTVAILARSLGLWVLNACRVVYLVEEELPVRRFGFAYGTLPVHAESGEERFQIEWHADDSVWYDIYAFSRPNQWLSRIAYPYVRYKQKQFARDSLLAMKTALARR